MSILKQMDEAVIKAKGVQSLPTRPNSLGLYGEGGLSAKELQL